MGGGLPAFALDLVLPAASEKTAEKTEAFGSLRLPTGPFADGVLPSLLVEGAMEMTAYRIAGMAGSTLEVMQGLQAQVEATGYQALFACEAEACGGYDFRYGTPILPEPDMHVNLGDYRYLLAEGPMGAMVALMVSRSGSIGFVQVTRLGEGAAGAAMTTRAPAAKPPAAKAAQPPLEPSSPPSASGLISAMEAGRAVVLEDLVFASGSAALVAGDYPSLAVLAEWLKADQARQIVLVGHTDASGTMEGNVNLSRLRAESVRQAMLYAHKVSPKQVSAEGVGPLAPRVSNLTEEGRQKNRRVEVIMTSTDLLKP